MQCPAPTCPKLRLCAPEATVNSSEHGGQQRQRTCGHKGSLARSLQGVKLPELPKAQLHPWEGGAAQHVGGRGGGWAAGEAAGAKGAAGAVDRVQAAWDTLGLLRGV